MRYLWSTIKSAIVSLWDVSEIVNRRPSAGMSEEAISNLRRAESDPWRC